MTTMHFEWSTEPDTVGDYILMDTTRLRSMMGWVVPPYSRNNRPFNNETDEQRAMWYYKVSGSYCKGLTEDAPRGYAQTKEAAMIALELVLN